MIGIKTHGKDLKKYAIKIKYLIHDYKGFWIQISTLIHWHTYTDQNLMHKNPGSCAQTINTLCNFCENFQN